MNFLYIANWKTYFTYNQTNQWLDQHYQSLTALARNHPIALFPSFESLALVAQKISRTPLLLGAHGCSAHKAGPYTGQVLAESLKELGCHWCYVGHPEIQKICSFSEQELVLKITLLLEHAITPVICLGETAQEYELNLTAPVLERTLYALLQPLQKYPATHKTIALAYEPCWVNSSGIIPSPSYIQKQLTYIKQVSSQLLPTYTILLLYGGGVNETNSRSFKDIDILNGLLIGAASTDFQKLEKIVLS